MKNTNLHELLKSLKPSSHIIGSSNAVELHFISPYLRDQAKKKIKKYQNVLIISETNHNDTSASMVISIR